MVSKMIIIIQFKLLYRQFLVSIPFPGVGLTLPFLLSIPEQWLGLVLGVIMVSCPESPPKRWYLCQWFILSHSMIHLGRFL